MIHKANSMPIIRFIIWFAIIGIALGVFISIVSIATGIVGFEKFDKLGLPPEGVTGAEHFGRRTALLLVTIGYILGIAFIIGAYWFTTEYIGDHWLYPASFVLLAMAFSRNRLGLYRDLYGPVGDYFIAVVSNSIGGAIVWTSAVLLFWKLLKWLSRTLLG